MSEKRHSRRDVMKATGAGTIDEGAIPEATIAQSTASDADVEYTLTVTDSDGERVGSTTVTDSFPLQEYGNRVLFANVGDTWFDGDNGIVDSIRYADGEVIEDWSDRDLSDYTMTRDGGGRFELTTDPVASGPKALRSFTGAGTSRITSDDDLVSIEDGVEIHGEVRHETDNSSSYAMQTGFGVGVDEGGQGGIRVRLVNPGSRRTAGARFITPNGRSRIRFTPELGEFYTFEIAVGVSPVQRVSAKATTLTLLPGYNERSEDPGGDELNSAIPDLSILDAAFIADDRLDLPKKLDEAIEATRGPFPEYPGLETKAYRLMNQIELSFETGDGQTISDWSSAMVRINEEEDPISPDGEWRPSYILVEGESEHGESNPVRELIDRPDYNWFMGKDKLPGDDRGWHDETLEIDVNLVKVGDVEGVRASIIRGARDTFILEMRRRIMRMSGLQRFNFYREFDMVDPIFGLPDPLVVLGIEWGPPYFYTFIDLVVMADGSTFTRVWDASRYPKHYLYIDNDQVDENVFEEGEEWNTREEPLENTRFQQTVSENRDSRTPFSPNIPKWYMWDFDRKRGQAGPPGHRTPPANGPHPVMEDVQGGEVLSETDLLEYNDFADPLFPWREWP